MSEQFVGAAAGCDADAGSIRVSRSILTLTDMTVQVFGKAPAARRLCLLA
jgi:hypothetical protein